MIPTPTVPRLDRREESLRARRRAALTLVPWATASAARRTTVRSSWAALRVYPSAHTNPVFVLVGGRPIRASHRSAEWLR